jgi:hypothetical protein
MNCGENQYTDDEGHQYIGVCAVCVCVWTSICIFNIDYHQNMKIMMCMSVRSYNKTDRCIYRTQITLYRPIFKYMILSCEFVCLESAVERVVYT